MSDDVQAVAGSENVVLAQGQGGFQANLTGGEPETAHPSAGTDRWCTPAWLADLLGPFGTDPCSNPRSHIQATRQLMLENGDDGLAIPWSGSVFANMPYSDVMPWAVRLADHDGPWVALVKLDPTTKWWAKLMSACPTVAPFRKRIKFETDKPGRGMTANFPSVLVYSAWRPPIALRPHLWLPTWEVAA